MHSRLLPFPLSRLSFLFLAAGPGLLANAPADRAMVEIIAAIEAPRIPAATFVITDFDATAGAGGNARPAIVAAIEAAGAAGGGRVIIPPGLWMCHGPLHLRSRLEVHLEAGAILRFGPDPADYLPVVPLRWEGTELLGYSPLIYGRDVTDVAITGPGTIDGNAESAFHSWHALQTDDMDRLRRLGNTDTRREDRVFAEGTYLRPDLLQIFGGQRILLADYRMENSPFWVNHLVYCDEVTVRGLTIDSHRPNNDGLDLDSCRYVLVENNHFRTGDDSVVIKSGRDLDGRRIGRPSEHIVVRHNDMGGEDGIALGSEMSGGIRQIYFTDNVLRHGVSAIRFKANQDRGGTVEEILVRNLRVESFDRHLIWFQLDYPGLLGGGHPATYRNLVFENIEVEEAGIFFEAHAAAAAPLENVVLRNISVERVEEPFILTNVKNLTLEQVRLGSQVITGTLDWRAP